MRNKAAHREMIGLNPLLCVVIGGNLCLTFKVQISNQQTWCFNSRRVIFTVCTELKLNPKIPVCLGSDFRAKTTEET